MYVELANIYGFRCFGKAVLKLRYPGLELESGKKLRFDNVNLILGDNGGGKSSVLRAIAIAMLAPALKESGFVAYRLVRRPDADHAFLKVGVRLEPHDTLKNVDGNENLELIARIDRAGKTSDQDRLNLERVPQSPLEKLIYDDTSHAFFVVGYGATRRVESGDFSPSSARKLRGTRYQRVASLFEDHIALRPVESLFKDMTKRKSEALDLINSVLPKGVELTGRADKRSNQQLVVMKNDAVPFSSLSDGYKAFIGMVCDLVGHLVDVCPKGMKLRDLPGIVLIDELDLHLHPAWQSRVVSDLATAFPRIQFIMTSHSPLVVSSVERENIFLTGVGDDGNATIKQIDERAFGRGIEQLLLSDYFGLVSARPKTSVEETKGLIDKVAKGDDDAALAFMQTLGAQTPNPKPKATPARRRVRKAK